MKKRKGKKNKPSQLAIQRAAQALRKKRKEREKNGIFPAKFMRMTLTEEAYTIIKDMEGAEFREFTSEAIRRAKR